MFSLFNSSWKNFSSHHFYYQHFNPVTGFLNAVVWITQTTNFLLVEVKKVKTTLKLHFLEFFMDVVVVHLLSCVWLFVTPWIVACQASLSFTISQSLLKLMSTESVMPSNHFILCHPFCSYPQSVPASGSFPMSGGSDGKEFACNTEDLGSIPGLERSPGEGNDYPLQYSCLENSMDRGNWEANSPWGRKESDTNEWLIHLYG